MPEPDGPTIATASPSSTVSDTPRSASTPPGYVLQTSTSFEDGHRAVTTFRPSRTPSPETSTMSSAYSPASTGSLRPSGSSSA